MDWKWFTGFCPSLEWDMAFQTDPKILDGEELPKLLRVRRLSRLVVTKDKKLKLIAWAPAWFNAVDKGSVARMPSGILMWICEATVEAGADWDAEWESPKHIAIVSEGEGVEEARLLAEKAKATANLAKELKRGPQGLVR